MPKRRARQIHLPRPRRSTMLGGEDRLTFVPERRIARMCAYVARVRAASPTHPSMLGIAYGSRCRVTLRISTKVSNATTAHNVDRTAVCALYVSIHIIPIIPHYTHYTHYTKYTHCTHCTHRSSREHRSCRASSFPPGPCPSSSLASPPHASTRHAHPVNSRRTEPVVVVRCLYSLHVRLPRSVPVAPLVKVGAAWVCLVRCMRAVRCTFAPVCRIIGILHAAGARLLAQVDRCHRACWRACSCIPSPAAVGA